MNRVFLKPALDKSADAQPGTPLKVRKPIGGHLDPKGEWQNLDSYWQRRINDKDVELVEGATQEEPEAGASSAGSARKTR